MLSGEKAESGGASWVLRLKDVFGGSWPETAWPEKNAEGRQNQQEIGSRLFSSRCAADAAATTGLQRLDVRGLHALRAALRFKAHLLAFCQALEAVGANFREVCEEVVAAVIRRDEAKTLGVVEPFNRTGIHENPEMNKC